MTLFATIFVSICGTKSRGARWCGARRVHPHQMSHRHSQVHICINKINPEDEKVLLKILFISFVKGASEYIFIRITVSTNLYEIKPTKYPG